MYWIVLEKSNSGKTYAHGIFAERKDAELFAEKNFGYRRHACETEIVLYWPKEISGLTC